MDSEYPVVRKFFINNDNVKIKTKTLEFSSKPTTDAIKEYAYSTLGSDDNDQFFTFTSSCKLTFNFMGKFAETFRDAVKIVTKNSSKSFENRVMNGENSDFTILAGNESFQVHKCIVSHANSSLTAPRLGDTEADSVSVNCKPEIMRHFLGFIYERDLPSDEQLKSTDICIGLHELAFYYDIRPLREICERYVAELFIDTENAEKVYEFASFFNIQSLRESSWEIVKT